MAKNARNSNLQYLQGDSLEISFHDLPKIADFCNSSSYLSFVEFQHGYHGLPIVRKTD